MKKNYDFLNNLSKDNIIQFFIQTDQKIDVLLKQLENKDAECNKKIDDIKNRNEKQKYREWKQHIDTHFLDRYLKEWLNEHNVKF